MADITKCHGTDCHERDTCWRYLAPVDPRGWQSWAAFDQQRTGEKCEWYKERDD